MFCFAPVLVRGLIDLTFAEIVIIALPPGPAQLVADD